MAKRILLCLGGCIIASTAQGQLIRTSEGVYQTYHTKIITAQSRRNEDKMGVWLITGPSIDPQLFNPAHLKPEGWLHVFLEYSAAVDRYVAVQIGETQYRVKGNFTLLVPGPYEQVRVGVDNNNPLMTIVVDNQQNPDRSYLLAFHGLKQVANESGPQKVALLEANQLNPEHRGIIEPYVLTKTGLELKGVRLSADNALGVELEPPKNPCLRAGTVFVQGSEVSRIRGLKREQGVQELEKLLASPPTADPLQGVLLLRIEASQMIGLDYSSGVIKTIHAIGRGVRPQICAVKEIPLGE